MTSPGFPSLEGRWQMIRAHLDGEAAPDLVVRRTALELGRGRYVVRFDDRIADAGTCELPADATARTLVLRGESGPNAGRTIPCLYQLVGDRLRICFGLDGEFPADFAASSAQPRYVATYRRQ